MSAVVWAAPYVPFTPPANPQAVSEYTHLWHGVDGSTWDLCDRSSGVWMQAGIVGMGPAGIDRWTQTSPSLAGNLFGGTRTQALDVQWPMVFASKDDPAEWKRIVRRWRNAWSKDVAGQWEVIDSDGRSVSLGLRWNPQAGLALESDPGIWPRAHWTWDAIADNPYWRGETVSRQWGSGQTPQPFFDTTTGMLPLHIMLASSFNNATIENPGTVATSPVFTITGPLDAFTIGVDDQTFTGPAVELGDQIIVDTSPQNPIALLNGTTDVTRQFTKWGSPSIPAGVTVPLTITTAGTGTVRAELTPLFEMGF